MTKRNNIVIGLVVLVAILVLLMIFVKKDPNDLSNMKADEYTMQGKVVKIDGQKIIVETGRVEKTDMGQQFVRRERAITTTTKTEFYEMRNGDAINLTRTDLGLVREGDTLTVYTKTDPGYEGDISEPFKIVLTK